MPKKFFKQFTPKSDAIKTYPSLKRLTPLFEDPNLLHLNRYSVSMAFLMGIFCAFLPIPGQMVAAAVLAFWVRANLPITLMLVWITNPLTIAPIYFSTYKLGTWLLDIPPINFEGGITLQTIGSEMKNFWKPFIVGSLSAGSFFSLLGYFLVKSMWRIAVLYKWRSRRLKRR